MTGVDTTAANLAVDTTANHGADTTANHVAVSTNVAFPEAGRDRNQEVTRQIPTSNGITPVATDTARIVVTEHSIADLNHVATGHSQTTNEATLVMAVTVRTQT